MLFVHLFRLKSPAKSFLPAASAENDRLVANLVSLSVLQGANLILPLLVFPYLVRVLGVEKFGMVAFAQAFSSYLMIITDYSFNLSATREVAIHRDDLRKLSRICGTVLAAKALLCLGSLVMLTAVVYAVPAFRAERSLYFLSFGLVVGQLLFPVWFFQGMERMKYITYLNVGAKVVFTASILWVVREPGDYVYVNFIQGLGATLTGLVSLWLVRRKFGVRFALPGSAAVGRELKEGFYIFTSSFAVNLYTYSNVFILGLTTNATVVGYYSMAEKVVALLRQVLVVFSQAVYPHVCKLALQSQASVRQFFRKFFVPFAGFIGLCCVAMYFLAGWIVYLLTGTALPTVSLLIKLLSVVPFIVLLNIPAYQTLLAYNLKKSYSSVLIAGSLLNLGLNYLLSKLHGAAGTAYAVIITELFITLGLYLVIERRNPHLSFMPKS